MFQHLMHNMITLGGCFDFPDPRTENLPYPDSGDVDVDAAGDSIKTIFQASILSLYRLLFWEVHVNIFVRSMIFHCFFVSGGESKISIRY